MVGRLGAGIGTRTGADGDGDDRINTIKIESSSLLRGTTTKTTTTTTTMIVAGTNKEETEAKEEEKQQQPQPHRMLQRPNHPCLLVRVETEFMRTVDNPLAAAATAAATATSSGVELTIDEASSLTTGLSSTVLVEEGQQQQRRHTNEVKCELLNEDDVDKAGGQYFVSIHGIEDGQFDQLDVESGGITLLAEGAVFLDGAMQIPVDAAIELGNISLDYTINITTSTNSNDNERERERQRQRLLQQQQQRRRLSSSRTLGTKSVLVVRVNAADVSTTASKNELSNNIFGTFGDTVTMKSQYQQCSHGNLQFQPYTGPTAEGVEVQNGVIEVDIDNTVQTSDRSTIEAAVQVAATEKVGNLRQFDHVMICLPPGSSGNRWIAYAYVNSWLSVYNDKWCQMLSTQVHEMGHNLGLAHSASGAVSYGDKSGMMGYSYFEENSPLQCFNPSKSYKLGWYSNKAVEWNPIQQGTWFGTIVGVADLNNNQLSNRNVIVKIPSTNDGTVDIYIGYNRQKGVNSGVKTNGNEVTIIEEAQGYSQSMFLSGLSPTNTYTIDNFRDSGKALIVDFIRIGTSIDEAFVAIYFNDCRYPDCCTGPLCHTSSPTNKPTTTPIAAPTPAPFTAAPIGEQQFKDASIAILYEIFPNPEKQRAEYIEIYNPGATSISLSKYQVCISNTDLSQSYCRQLTNNYTLQSKESYIFCRDQYFVEDNNNMLPSNKMCHQDGNNNLRLRNRNQKVVLTLNNIEVDEVFIQNANKRKGQAYVRKSGCTAKNSESCWAWSSEVAMASTTIWDNDDEIMAKSLVEIGIQSLPPSDVDGNVADVYGDEWWQ